MPKLVVDSSVWIDFFNKKNSPQVEHLEMLLLTSESHSPVIILPVILQEVLQGVEKDKLFTVVQENLLGLVILIMNLMNLQLKLPII